MVTGADAGGIAKIDVSALFLRHFFDFRVFFLEPLLHEGFVTSRARCNGFRQVMPS